MRRVGWEGAPVTTQIALLRAINVGGRKKIAMSDLRELLAQLGFAGARSLLQTGNLVFRSDEHKGDALERLLEAQIEKRLDLRTDFFVRSAKQWQEVIASNPFPEEAERDPSHLVAIFLKDAPAAKDVRTLRAAIRGSEIIRGAGKQVYVFYPNGIGRSRLTNAFIEHKLRTSGTGRNWNTILKVGALAEEVTRGGAA